MSQSLGSSATEAHKIVERDCARADKKRFQDLCGMGGSPMSGPIFPQKYTGGPPVPPHSLAGGGAKWCKGFTLIEMLTTVAALVIILGLMVSLARDVRGRSAESLTRELLNHLEGLMATHPDMQEKFAKVPTLVGALSLKLDDEELQKAALENNRAFVEVWLRSPYPQVFDSLPLSRFDGHNLRDAWGAPIAFMAAGAPNIRIARQSRYFFMSAGPDRKFTTLLDNLYSYERPGNDGQMQRRGEMANGRNGDRSPTCLVADSRFQVLF